MGKWYDGETLRSDNEEWEKEPHEEMEFESEAYKNLVGFSGDRFQIGSGYTKEGEGAAELQCNQCGSTAFNVGRASLYTAIRCINCGYEFCVHEG